jgi:hypothetical protein
VGWDGSEISSGDGAAHVSGLPSLVLNEEEFVGWLGGINNIPDRGS